MICGLLHLTYTFPFVFMEPVLPKSIDKLFRHETGKLVSVLTKVLGLENLDSAQDIVQDTLLQALSTWPYNGMPDNPSA